MQEDKCEHCGRLVTSRLPNGRIRHVGDHHRRAIFSDNYSTWSRANEMIDRSAPVHHQIPFVGGPLDGQMHHSLNRFPKEVRHETSDGVAVYRTASAPDTEYRFKGFE